MLAFACREQVYLTAARRKCAGVLAAYAKENKFSDVPKIKSNTATIRPSILSDLVPHKIGFVGETPRFHYRESIGQQGVWHPQIEMRGGFCDVVDGQLHDLRQGHGAVARQPPMLGRYLSRPIDELPRRISQDRREARLAYKIEQIGSGSRHLVLTLSSGIKILAKKDSPSVNDD